ncbi:hypothetical protein XFF6991_420042 [Xanthomonas phaseoli pv. phaseoli]|uniref:Uncharacterized protein n=1 Tax=Xanthomonas campestris pv. phaseoli TaxID=317013 RepID=A0A7Z7NHB4_XANCH|nr:hypothetical protein XFF6991_420042 [Xanthomonas phaseoli pv. phaseoli]
MPRAISRALLHAQASISPARWRRYKPRTKPLWGFEGLSDCQAREQEVKARALGITEMPRLTGISRHLCTPASPR